MRLKRYGRIYWKAGKRLFIVFFEPGAFTEIECEGNAQDFEVDDFVEILEKDNEPLKIFLCDVNKCNECAAYYDGKLQEMCPFKCLKYYKDRLDQKYEDTVKIIKRIEAFGRTQLVLESVKDDSSDIKQRYITNAFYSYSWVYRAIKDEDSPDLNHYDIVAWQLDDASYKCVYNDRNSEYSYWTVSEWECTVPVDLTTFKFKRH